MSLACKYTRQLQNRCVFLLLSHSFFNQSPARTSVSPVLLSHALVYYIGAIPSADSPYLERQNDCVIDVWIFCANIHTLVTSILCYHTQSLSLLPFPFYMATFPPFSFPIILPHLIPQLPCLFSSLRCVFFFIAQSLGCNSFNWLVTPVTLSIHSYSAGIFYLGSVSVLYTPSLHTPLIHFFSASPLFSDRIGE